MTPSDTGIPATVEPGEYKTRLVLAIKTAFGNSVTTYSATLKVDITIMFGKSTVDVPVTRPLAPRDIDVLHVVMTCALVLSTLRSELLDPRVNEIVVETFKAKET